MAADCSPGENMNSAFAQGILKGNCASPPMPFDAGKSSGVAFGAE